MGRAAGGPALWTFLLRGVLLLAVRHALGTGEEACNCSTAGAFSDFQAAPPPEVCCLNFTGTEIDSLDWSVFGSLTGLRALYLSQCGISDIVNVTAAAIQLEVLSLDHNRLEKFPESFLRDAPQLRVLRLDSNKLRELPKSFLSASSRIQELDLSCNDLASLPSSVFQPSLARLGLSNNSWACTCTLWSDLERYSQAPPSGERQGPVVLCSAPERYRGRDIQDLPKQELCRAHSLMALFICLPLVVVLAVATWCFCRRKGKPGYALSHQPECHLATVERNGAKGLAEHPRYLPCQLPAAPTESEKNVLLKNQILLKPATALLGSNRDLYEEVEIQLGASDDSLVLVNEGSLRQELGPTAAAEERAGSAPEAETVSVTDVLKDSVDREKLYMSQAADYYNLVPAIELEDSDHQEYENVDLH